MTRVALLDQARGETSARLLDALRGSGTSAVLLDPRPIAVAESILRRRGFTHPLTPTAGALRLLRRGGYAVAQAFSAEDAAAALLWRRLGGGAVVFSPAEPLERESMADGRLRLALVTAALEQSDLVIAPSEESRAALWRWCAVDAPLVEPDDAAAHERLYASLSLTYGA